MWKALSTRRVASVRKVLYVEPFPFHTCRAASVSPPPPSLFMLFYELNSILFASLLENHFFFLSAFFSLFIACCLLNSTTKKKYLKFLKSLFFFLFRISHCNLCVYGYCGVAGDFKWFLSPKNVIVFLVFCTTPSEPTFDRTLDRNFVAKAKAKSIDKTIESDPTAYVWVWPQSSELNSGLSVGDTYFGRIESISSTSLTLSTYRLCDDNRLANWAKSLYQQSLHELLIRCIWLPNSITHATWVGNQR